MKLSRRHLAAAGALALSAPTLIPSTHAQSADEATVKKAVEELRTAWIKQGQSEDRVAHRGAAELQPF